MAVDALEYDDTSDDVNPAGALEEILENPEKLKVWHFICICIMYINAYMCVMMSLHAMCCWKSQDWESRVYKNLW